MSMKITITVGGRKSNFLLLGEDVCKNLAEVKEFYSSRFQQLENEKGIKIFWKDQDGDEISVVKEADFRSFLLATGSEKVRLYVEANEETPVDPGPEHTGVLCDECEQGIVGHRYKCLMCVDYDLCMDCESKHRHKDHMMVRFPRSIKGTQSRGDAMRVSAWIDRMGRYAKKIDLLLSGAKDTEANGNGNGVDIDEDDDKIHGWGPREISFKVTRSMSAKESHLAQGKPKLQSNGQGKHKQQSMSKADAGASSKMREQPKRPKEKQVSSARSNFVGIFKHDPQREQSSNTASTVYCPQHNIYHVKRPLEKPLSTKDPKEPTSAANAATGVTQGQVSSKPSNTATGVKQEQGSSKPTSPTGSVVTGLVDGVLKHTPPEWNKFLPTEEEMNRLSSKVSGLLSVLGLEVTMPPTGGEAASTPSGSSKKETEPKTSEEEKDPQSGSMNSAKEEKQEKVAANNPPEIISVTKKALPETENVAVSASQDAEKLPEGKDEVQQLAMEKDDSSSDASSASMLTDDDEEVVEVAQVAEQNTSPQALPSRLEVPWIMVDLPDDREEEVKQAVANTTSAVPVASTSVEKVDDKQTPEETSPKQQPEVEEFYANTFQNMVDLVKQLTVDPKGAERKVSELIEGSQKEKNKLVQDDRYKAHLEKAAKELEKHLLEVKNKEQIERMQQNLPSPTKEQASPVRLNPMADAFTMSRTRAVPVRMYSRRPHVNHAVQTMITMGFSNQDGRLTHLLEALNGDIPRALDRLMQNMP
ncbi:AGAP009928-PA-like protein [Anopheles sinensis]|uniref:AGAP009928-PA-like protein n=1 Tax=Anopheles sinensis TaxID=74873 RepID=A0A084W8R0_ANOSI|nr:AGAP009928-PA-like protein [Anopheles sinensis]